jgi:hypothetical protein
LVTPELDKWKEILEMQNTITEWPGYLIDSILSSHVQTIRIYPTHPQNTIYYNWSGVFYKCEYLLVERGKKWTKSIIKVE